MRAVPCTGGHFFDRDRFAVCPFCGQPEEQKTQESKPETKSSKGGFRSVFSKPKKQDNKVEPVQKWTSVMQSRPSTNQITPPSMHPDPPVTGDSFNWNLQTNEPDPGKKTESLWDNESGNGAGDSTTNRGPGTSWVSQIPANTANSGSEGMSSGPNVSGTSQESEGAGTYSLDEEIQRASANNSGKTMSYFSMMSENKSSVASSAPATPSSNNTSSAASAAAASTTVPNCGNIRQGEPVTGWLVAVSGPHFGESFCIYSGMNTIGRKEGNDVQLSRDNATSREKHALLTYEPKHRQFYVAPGGSSGLTYLNNDFITATMLMHDHDIIEVGASKLMLIVLCNDSFSWEDYIEK